MSLGHSEQSACAQQLARSYPADAASIPLARVELREFAEARGARGEQLEDIALSISEALTNVVEHAYARPGGEIHICAGLEGDQLAVVVADDGRGLGRPDGDGLHLGMPIMSELSDRLTLKERPGGGFEVHLLFDLAAPTAR